jgi:hypothetical protein
MMGMLSDARILCEGRRKAAMDAPWLEHLLPDKTKTENPVYFILKIKVNGKSLCRIAFNFAV